MKLWVALWHHKHGTNIEAASTEKLARKVTAERVLEMMQQFFPAHSVTDETRAVIEAGDYLRACELWKHHFKPEERFQFQQVDLHEEHD